MLMFLQIPEWLYLDCGTPAFFHYLAHSDNGSFAFGCRKSGLACLLNKAKVGHAGHAECRRRSASLERVEAAKQ